ncbi:MAG TPA: hypothetical protein VGX48_17685 [Pyrinomonadaceae bacterium]|jgi:hypothetical protein|nr:hypothetical protein [Pyrinomonadaceae bacterium]
MVKVILERPYGLLAKGDTMEVTRGVAEQLITRGIARAADDADGKREKRGRK